jgi:hypothetical protein
VSELPHERAGTPAEGARNTRGRRSAKPGHPGPARCAPTSRRRPIPAFFAIDYEHWPTPRPRCATLTRERSRQDWRGGPSPTPNAHVRPMNCGPETGRRGPPELWIRFDAAVQQLNQAGAGDNLADVVGAYAAVAKTASQVADALQAAGAYATCTQLGQQLAQRASGRRQECRKHAGAGASDQLRGAVALPTEAGASPRRVETLAARPNQARHGQRAGRSHCVPERKRRPSR